AAVLEVMGFPFIESARALGGGGLRIMVRHLIPNIVAPLIVLTTVYFSTAILSEATLSFLGLGTQPPEAAWGNMLSTARSYIDQSVWMSIFPGVAIMVVVMGFNFLGDGLRDVLDPRIGGGVALDDRGTDAHVRLRRHRGVDDVRRAPRLHHEAGPRAEPRLVRGSQRGALRGRCLRHAGDRAGAAADGAARARGDARGRARPVDRARVPARPRGSDRRDRAAEQGRRRVRRLLHEPH